MHWEMFDKLSAVFKSTESTEMLTKDIFYQGYYESMFTALFFHSFKSL